jgi:predicted MFS family arabinose efflux permease
MSSVNIFRAMSIAIVSVSTACFAIAHSIFWATGAVEISNTQAKRKKSKAAQIAPFPTSRTIMTKSTPN